ncbi:MAG: hypothetical protein U5L96_15760 [Owenweeksia sp.]|nr:hypothetical protein [Owenweeksia sp.]
MGKPLLCVIAPNKVRYMPENLPENYVKEPGDTSNYSRAVRLLRREKYPPWM